MSNRLQVSLLCGGQSVEHAISLLSAQNMYRALDSKKYDVRIVYISEWGCWFVLEQADDLLGTADKEALLQTPMQALTVSMGIDRATKPWVIAATGEALSCDVVIPCTHGTFGEDGSMQGLLDMLGVAYVGSGVLGSALAMDKIACKQIFMSQNLPTVDWVELSNDKECPNFDQIVKQLGSPVVVKAANLGSSIGVALAHNADEFDQAATKAFEHSDRVLVEAYVEGREIECAVLGNEHPSASISGEIVCSGMYSYAAKYLDETAAKVVIPADLPDSVHNTIRDWAIKAFRALGCLGLARFDCFIDQAGQVWLNELNTLPGFTDISMYPKLWQHEGLETAELLDQLIGLAQDRAKTVQQLKRQYVD